MYLSLMLVKFISFGETSHFHFGSCNIYELSCYSITRLLLRQQLLVHHVTITTPQLMHGNNRTSIYMKSTLFTRLVLTAISAQVNYNATVAD